MAQTYPVPKENPNMMMVVSFVSLYATSVIVIGLANMFFPMQIVLGTMNIPFFSALLLSSAVIAGIGVLTMPFFTEFEMWQKRVLKPQDWIAGYLVINTIGLWLVTRAAEIFGLGISSWMYVVALAAVLDIAQGMVMMSVPPMFMKKQK